LFNIYALAKLRIKLFLSNRNFLLFSIVAPIVLLLLVNGFFSNYDNNVSIPIGIVDLDQSPMSQSIIEKIKVNPSLKATNISIKDGMKMIENNQIEAYFVFKENFSSNIQNLKYKESVSINYLDKNFIAPSLIDLVAKDIMYEISKYSAYKKTYLYTKDEVVASNTIADYDTLISKKSFDMSIDYKIIKPATGSEYTLDYKRLLPFKLSVGLSLTFIMIFIMFSNSTLIIEKEQKTEERLTAIGISKFKIFIGNFIGEFLNGTVIILIYIFALLLFNKDASLLNIGGIFIILEAYLLSVILIAMIVAKYINSLDLYQNIITPFVFVISLIGGGIWPIDAFPSNFQSLAIFSPIYWTSQGVTNFVFSDFSYNSNLYNNLGFLMMFSTIVLYFSMLILNKD